MIHKNFVPAQPPLSERLRHAWRIVWRVALPGAVVLAALWIALQFAY